MIVVLYRYFKLKKKRCCVRLRLSILFVTNCTRKRKCSALKGDACKDKALLPNHDVFMEIFDGTKFSCLVTCRSSHFKIVLCCQTGTILFLTMFFNLIENVQIKYTNFQGLRNINKIKWLPFDRITHFKREGKQNNFKNLIPSKFSIN